MIISSSRSPRRRRPAEVKDLLKSPLLCLHPSSHSRPHQRSQNSPSKRIRRREVVGTPLFSAACSPFVAEDHTKARMSQRFRSDDDAPSSDSSSARQGPAPSHWAENPGRPDVALQKYLDLFFFFFFFLTTIRKRRLHGVTLRSHLSSLLHSAKPLRRHPITYTQAPFF